MAIDKKIEEISIGLIYLSILVGQVALPIFFNVSTSSLDTTQLTVWGLAVTFALLGIGLMFLRYLRGGNKR